MSASPGASVPLGQRPSGTDALAVLVTDDQAAGAGPPGDEVVRRPPWPFDDDPGDGRSRSTLRLLVRM